MGKRKILLIGGSGFIGHALIPLLRPSYDIWVLSRGRHPSSSRDIQYLKADRQQTEQLHAAATSIGPMHAVVDICPSDAPDTQKVWNAFGPLTSHWVSISSVAVYRDSLGAFPTEHHAVGGSKMWGAYGQGKTRSDQFLLSVASNQTPVSIFRPTYLYGPGNSQNRESFIWDQLCQNRPIVLPGNGQALAQFLHVQDLAQGICLAIQKPPSKSALYNIAGDDIVSLEKWVNMLAGIAGITDPIIRTQFLPGRPYFPFLNHPCCADTALIRQRLGWRPTYSLQEGFEQTFSTWSPAPQPHPARMLPLPSAVMG